MPLFAVVVEGKRLPGDMIEGNHQFCGFFTTARVEAPDSGTANALALHHTREWLLREFTQLHDKIDGIELLIDSTDELLSFSKEEGVSGATWFGIDGMDEQ
ncbi:hypothetical protein [Aurantiacibacter sp. MUD61]|uniref:hypothetical protein n=1 Tax=Aurantiacibacter sp. MUD61 TaxID=3009083 RepID=UPI0022F13F22|nr:hypothetical protein [Aurantiacibacter sp. MUD61]